ncbi:hypothetical protein ColLi_11695 [Colletotrichum liriopes]|uniref:Uncharacterized protein n=1 Tax=Colletotrichum liriopes TaxID=708192 RepID=A0AA37LY00_9PEZI|nr:hypothetical protein ColLi_11695 [Colletotrichum liriopes]
MKSGIKPVRRHPPNILQELDFDISFFFFNIKYRNISVSEPGPDSHHSDDTAANWRPSSDFHEASF